jgi:hypothetical protein
MDEEKIMSSNDLPEYFDAVLNIRFTTEELIRGLAEDGIENPDLDDILIAIDARLYNEFKSSKRDFSVFDPRGEEY